MKDFMRNCMERHDLMHFVSGHVKIYKLYNMAECWTSKSVRQRCFRDSLEKPVQGVCTVL